MTDTISGNAENLEVVKAPEEDAQEHDEFKAANDEEEADAAVIDEVMAEEEKIFDDAAPVVETTETEIEKPKQEGKATPEEKTSEELQAEGEEGKPKEDEEKKPDEPAAEEEPKDVVEPSSEIPPKPEPSEGDSPELTLEDVRERWGEIRENAEVNLAETHYAFSDEEVAELSTNAEVAIPKMMAKVYMDSVQASITHIVTELPRLLQQTQEAQTQASSNENAFFEAWPQLMEHRDRVFNLASTYRQVNPNASLEQTISDVGAQAIIALRLPVDGLIDAGNDEHEESLPPHKPPGGGSPPAGVPQRKSTNPFEQMAEDMLNEGEELDLD
jgi:outer membrane biosynthesis protein TonB